MISKEIRCVRSHILKLYPPPAMERPLEGLYLEQDLRAQAADRGRPWVLANFITSLDGRIAVAPASDKPPTVPELLINPRDWRLFQEIAVQADLWFISGRYLREHARGAAQELLKIEQESSWADLLAWRASRGLPRRPAIAILSTRLDFDLPPSLLDLHTPPLILTTEQAPEERLRALQSQGAEALPLGKDTIEGPRLLEALAARGHRLIFSAAGPRIAHMLLRQGALDRLYLTLASRMLGGERFASILEGERISPPADWSLRSLHFDPHALEGAGQLYACFDRRTDA